MSDNQEGIIKELKRDDSLDYINILKALNEIPFSVGKNLLIDFLAGNFKNSSIRDNNLDELSLFGCLNYKKERLMDLLDNAINNNLI